MDEKVCKIIALIQIANEYLASGAPGMLKFVNTGLPLSNEGRKTLKGYGYTGQGLR